MKKFVYVLIVLLLTLFSIPKAEENLEKLLPDIELQEKCLKEDVKKESELYKKCEEQVKLLNRLGVQKIDQGKYKEAFYILKKAVKISRKALGENHPYTALSYNNIGFVYYKLDNYQKALWYYHKALNIGDVYDKLKNYKKALWYYEKALKILEKSELLSNKLESFLLHS